MKVRAWARVGGLNRRCEIERVGWVVQSKAGEVRVKCAGVKDGGGSGVGARDVRGEFW